MEQASNRPDCNGKNVFHYEDQEHQSTLLDNLNMLRKNRQFCDVIIQVGNSQDIHEIYAHKVVLSSASPYFLEMFSTDPLNVNGGSPGLQQYRLVNNGHQGPKNANGVQQFDSEAFDHIIEYAYTAKLEIPAEKVREIYAIATRLKMTSVAYKCGQFLLSTLTPENCLDVRNMKAVLKDPYLLQSVDGYIRQNFEKIVQEKSTFYSQLVHVKIEFLLNSEQEEQSINDRHLFNEIIEWIHSSFEKDTLDLTSLKENMLMLYYNKALNEIQDCSEIEPKTPEELEIIEDYKKLMKRNSCSGGGGALVKTPSSDNIHVTNGSHCNGNGVEKTNGQRKTKQLVPSKPRQFMFTRSDSESSLSSIVDDDEGQDWKLLANCRMGEHSLVGLVSICAQVCLITVKLRVNSNSLSSANRKENSETNDYCLIPPMSSPRCAVGTAELGGKLFVCGGYDRGECLKTVEVYDTVSNKWETLQHMQVPRGRFAIAVVDNNVYAIGGCDGHNELNSAEFYDSLTLNWKLIQSAPVVRSNAGVCSMNSEIYVIGGWNGNRGLTRCDMYDPAMGKWVEICHLNTGRYQTGVCTMNNVIYAVGGCDSWSCLNSVEAMINGQWKLVAPLQTSRRGCGVATFEGKIYAVGGHDGVHALCSVEIYDPIEDRWTFGKSMTVARANVGVAVVDRRLYAVGGFNGKTFLNTIEYFDFDTNEWTTSVPINKPANVGKITSNFDAKSNENVEIKLNNGLNGNDLETVKNGHQTNNNNNSHIMNNYNHNNNNNNSLCSDMLKKESHISSKLKNSLSSEPLVEVEETAVGH